MKIALDAKSSARLLITSLLMMTMILLLPAVLFAQEWSSGFDPAKSDGEFNIQSTDPRVQNGIFTWDPVRDGYDQDGDNIYHFTKFTVGSNVGVRMLANRFRNMGPVVIIVQGPVLLNGYIDLSGESGHNATQDYTNRKPSIPGPGGYPGGAGAKPGDLAQRGSGPGGGIAPAGNNEGCNASHVTDVNSDIARCAGSGGIYGTTYIQPLIGGSGGSGGSAYGTWSGMGGGAGGGAILIISGDSITLPGGGNIWAVGGTKGTGNGYNGGSGSGGAIHLQAPKVHIYNGSGLYTYGGNGAANGRIRIDTNNLVSYSSNPAAVTGPLVPIALPTGLPSIRIAAINGQSVTQNPTGSYTAPDLSIDTADPVPIRVEASKIPVGTPVNLHLSFESGGADTIVTINLQGTLESSNATFNVTLPKGVSRFFARAVW
jgi:hypothetical protein